MLTMTRAMQSPYAKQAYGSLRDSYLRAGLNPAGIRPREVEALARSLQSRAEDAEALECAKIGDEALALRVATLGR